MPVQRFNLSGTTVQTGGYLYMGAGAATAGLNAWSMAMLVRPHLLDYRVLFCGHRGSNQATATGYAFEMNSDGSIGMWSSGAGESFALPGALAAGAWRIVVLTKPAGFLPPRAYSFRFTSGRSGTWSWGDGGIAVNPPPAAPDYVNFGTWQNGYWYVGDMAAVTQWPVQLSQAQVTALSDIPDLASWARHAAPVATWLHNTTPVQDVVGAADELGRTANVTSLAEEPPIPFVQTGVQLVANVGGVARTGQLFANVGGVAVPATAITRAS